MVYLENPNGVVEDGYAAFGSAIWYWMTPQNPKPSCHDMMSGFFKPSSADLGGGLAQYNGLNGFGTTTMIINGGSECGGGMNNIAK